MTGRGRPAIGERIPVRLSPDAIIRLDRLAADLDVSRAEIVRRAVDVYLADPTPADE